MHNFSGWMTVLALEAFAYARNAGVVRVVFCRLKEVRVLMRRGGGIAALSANRFGRVSPTSAAHVIAAVGGALGCVIDGGSCKVGFESIILDLSGQYPRVLRPGGDARRAYSYPRRVALHGRGRRPTGTGLPGIALRTGYPAAANGDGAH
jgi:hypothetical protein